MVLIKKPFSLNILEVIVIFVGIPILFGSPGTT